MRTIIFCLLTVLSLTACREEGKASESPCDGRQWNNTQEYLDCHFPKPPIGRWHAVYTEEFAKEHSLPLENVSKDLSPGVDYMEMDVQPYADGLTACLVNMLIKKPNDVAVFNSYGEDFSWSSKLHERRKLIHSLDLNIDKSTLRRITTFGLAPRNMQYDPKKTYGIGSSFAFYSRDLVGSYDYFLANADCYHIISTKERFPAGWAFNIAKASVWGREKPRYLEGWKTPKDKDFFNSLFLINIPHELVSAIMKDMPIGGR